MSKAFYDDLWSNKTFRYSPSKLIRERWVLYLLKKKVRFSNGKFFLDLGCGRGTLLKKVARVYPGAKLAGADYSDEAINANKSEQPYVHFKALDFEKSSLKDAFRNVDCIVAQEVIEHLSLKVHVQFLSAIANMLSNKGLAIVTTPDWEAIQGLRYKGESDIAFAKRFEGQPNANLLTRNQLRGVAKAAGFRVIWHKTVCPYIRNKYLTNFLNIILFALPLTVEEFFLDRIGMRGKYQIILLQKEN